MKLEFKNVEKSFGPHRVIRDISLSVEFSHVLCLIGPSGGGKSTLLRMLAGLEPLSSGEIYLDDTRQPSDEVSLRHFRKRLGVVFQAYNLFPHLSALENVVLPLVEVHRLSRDDANKRARSVLERLRLEKEEAKRPSALSGGQKQRVAIARALAIHPEMLLFDEPTSALDPEMTAEVLDVIAELKKEDRKFVMVTHEMGFARQIADVVAFIAEGKVLEIADAPSFFESPKSEEAKLFLSKILKY
ncbi:MAG: amino acid ABC transporter ATP-binding protein [Chthoniobacterales bacterium]